MCLIHESSKIDSGWYPKKPRKARKEAKDPGLLDEGDWQAVQTPREFNGTERNSEEWEVCDPDTNNAGSDEEPENQLGEYVEYLYDSDDELYEGSDLELLQGKLHAKLTEELYGKEVDSQPDTQPEKGVVDAGYEGKEATYPTTTEEVPPLQGKESSYGKWEEKPLWIPLKGARRSDLSTVVQEFLPPGGWFTTAGGYWTPDGMLIPGSLRRRLDQIKLEYQ